MNRLLRRRQARVIESQEAIAKQERLAEYIAQQREEARELAKWANDRLQKNHLSQLFINTHGRGA